MINLLLGPPGGGKSYEAVVYHILPALEAGRKVITNLPLDVDYIAKINAGFLPLIEIRTTTKKERPITDLKAAESKFQKFGIAVKQNYFINAPFAHAEDYGDPWRHPLSGSGPLYVVDECHIPLPGRGTEMEVEHWYSLHRHESADVLLITQSYGKINRAILDLVQICYRVKKNTSMGSEKTYVRKVQDGVRGEVVNTGIRKYEKQYFPFYKSHTRGGGAELAAQDIVPLWKRWPFIGAAICFSLFFVVIIGFDVKNPMNAKSYKKPDTEHLKPVVPSGTISVSSVALPPKIDSKTTSSNPPQAKESEPEHDPYENNGIHIVGHVASKTKTIWVVNLSQNGLRLKNISADDLTKIGYVFTPINDCGAWLTYKTVKRFIKCDSPSVAVTGSFSGSISSPQL